MKRRQSSAFGMEFRAARPLKRSRFFGPQRRRGRGRRARFRSVPALGVEKKFYDTLVVDSAIVSPAGPTGGEQNPTAVICLNSVTQGDGEQQRDGRRMTMVSIHVTGNVKQTTQTNQTALDVAPTIFLALVLDTQTNGALLNSEDVFANPSVDNVLAANLLRNLQFSRRFKVLKSLTFMMPIAQAVYDGTNIEIGGVVRPFRMDVMLDVSSTFSGTTETIANITDNSLTFIAFASDIGAAPLLSYNARLRFVG